MYANNMVRVKPDVQKIDKFFPTLSKLNETEKVLEKEEDIFEEDEVQEESDRQNKISNIVIEDSQSDVLDNSIVNEPTETNKLPDRWKAHTAADQANSTYIDPKESFKTRTFKYERIETKLTSVKQLRLDVEKKCNSNLREILANLIFIACIDCHKSLIQHSTKLYLCDTTRLT